MRRGDIILETSLGRLLEAYADYCRRSGLRESGVQLYQKLSLRSLKGLEDAGVTEAAGIGPHEVSCARLALKSNYYLSAIHTFLPVLRFWLTNRYTVPWLTEYALAILPHHVWLHIRVPAAPVLHCAAYSHLHYLLYRHCQLLLLFLIIAIRARIIKTQKGYYALPYASIIKKETFTMSLDI